MSCIPSSYSRMASSMRSVAVAQHGALQGSCAVNKFVDAVAALHAALEDVDDGFVAEEDFRIRRE